MHISWSVLHDTRMKILDRFKESELSLFEFNFISTNLDDQPQRKKFHLPLLDKEKQSQAAAVTSQNAVADDHQDKPLELKAVPNPYLSAAAARFAKVLSVILYLY